MSCPRCSGVCRCDPATRFESRLRFEPDTELDREANTRAELSSEGASGRGVFAAGMEAEMAAPRNPRQKFVVDAQKPESPKLYAGDESDDATAVPPRGADIGSRNGQSEAAISISGAAASTVNTYVEDVAKKDCGTTGLNSGISQDMEPWRQELAARLDRYRSRRKPKAPRYPSLRLRFDPQEPARTETASSSIPVTSSEAVAVRSPEAPSMCTAQIPEAQTRSERAQVEAENKHPVPKPSRELPPNSVPEPWGKLIEFPRFGPSSAIGDELADPIMDQPRILEVPEIAPPPPALGGIMIETEADEEPPKRPGIDIPLRTASVERRLFATAIDGLTVLLGVALFAYVSLRVSALFAVGINVLPLPELAGILAGVAAVLWATYQYMMMVYTGNTPGLRLAKLQVSCFDGRAVGRPLRRWRVLVSFLSVGSLGMGYAWFFLDEDSLCWHDRMTHTYLGPAPGQGAASDTATEEL